MSETYFSGNLWAIKLTKKPPAGWFLASGGETPVAVFSQRKRAVQFRDELKKAGCSKGRLVRVEVKISTPIAESAPPRFVRSTE